MAEIVDATSKKIATLEIEGEEEGSPGMLTILSNTIYCRWSSIFAAFLICGITYLRSRKVYQTSRYTVCPWLIRDGLF